MNLRSSKTKRRKLDEESESWGLLAVKRKRRKLNEESWALLPAKNLQDIFKNLHTIDVENCLGVCRHWFDEANFFLKDKFWFSIGKVRRLEDFNVSKRRFQFLLVIQDKYTNMTFLEKRLHSLRKRKTTDPILAARIEYYDYQSLARILQILHEKHVKSFLTLVNKSSKPIKRRSQRLELKLQQLNYGCLSSVERLEVFNCDNSLLRISKSFGNLKSLKLNTCDFSSDVTVEYVSRHLLRNFIVLNGSMKALYLGNADFIVTGDDPTGDNGDEVVGLLSPFENAKSLEILHLRDVCNAYDIEILSTQFRHLQVINIKNIASSLLLPNHVNSLLQMPNVEFQGMVGYDNEYLDDRIWLDSWTYSRNFNITHLNLNRSIPEDVLRVFFKSFPNLKVFEFLFEGDAYTSIFAEMSKNWTKLETLAIGFGSDLLPTNTNEVFDFKNLRRLEVYEFPLSMEGFHEFIAFFRAVNLKSVVLDFRNSQQKYTKQTLFTIIMNYVSIDRLEIRGGVVSGNLIVERFGNFMKVTVENMFNYDLYSSTLSLVRTLEVLSVLKPDGATWKDVIKQPLHKLCCISLMSFCQAIGAVTHYDYKNAVLKGICLKNMNILFL